MQTAQIMQDRMSKADKRSKWLSICLTTFYCVTMLTIIVVSFPVMCLVNQD